MKKLSIFSLVLMLAATTAHGQAKKTARASNNLTTLERMKFGPRVNLAVLSQDYGAFVEYQLTQELGIRSGLAYSKDRYFAMGIGEEQSKDGMIIPQYMTVPIIMNCYPGEDRQFYLFGGLQPSFLLKGKLINSPTSFNTLDEEKLKRAIKVLTEAAQGRLELEEEDLKQKEGIRRLVLSAAVGLGYETKFGLIMGLEYAKVLRDLIKCKDTILNWTFQIDLGYNVAKLFG